MAYIKKIRYVKNFFILVIIYISFIILKSRKGVFTVAKSICEHIRNVKSSLENAEKSFRENNGMRGELI